MNRLRWATSVGLLALLLACAACSDSDHKQLHPVVGKMLCQSRPATGALVYLYAVGSDEKTTLRPHGCVGEDGSFRLSTYEPGDGAPAGTYQVAVFWTKPSKLGGDDIENLLPPRYWNPATSGIPSVTVTEGNNKLPTIVLNK
jgi:hypothetical protein